MGSTAVRVILSKNECDFGQLEMLYEVMYLKIDGLKGVADTKQNSKECEMPKRQKRLDDGRGHEGGGEKEVWAGMLRF